MSSHLFNIGRAAIANEDINSATIKAVPLMTNTTADDADTDAISTVDDIGTLDQFDGSGYSAGGVTLSNVAAVVDNGDDRANLDADDVTGLSYGDGTRAVAGWLIILFDTDLNSSVPLVWLEYSSAIAGSALAELVFGADGFMRI